jgi:hypothetical protein
MCRPKALAPLAREGKGTFPDSKTLYVSTHLSALSANNEQHIQQLLRTLNLNSPAPYSQPPSLSHSTDLSPSSPDFSPISTTSPLLTPTDLSPARSFDPKFNATYDLGRSAIHSSESSLLFESNPLKRLQDMPSSDPSPYRPSHNQSPYPLLEPPSDTCLFSPQTYKAHNHPQPVAARRPEPPRGPSMTWRSQHQSSEWLRPTEKLFIGETFGHGAAENLAPSRLPFSTQHANQGSNNSSHAHEVGHLPIDIMHPQYLLSMDCDLLAYQFSLASASILLSSLPCVRGAYHQVLGPASIYFSAAKTQSCRSGRTFQDC